jgi:hypothetical protein
MPSGGMGPIKPWPAHGCCDRCEAPSALGEHQHAGNDRTTKAFILHFREKRACLFINTTWLAGLITFPFNSICSHRRGGTAFPGRDKSGLESY